MVRTQVATRLAAALAFATPALFGTAQAADAGAGERVFRTQCSACHSVQPGRNMVGPSLAGVVGRASGSVAGFHYSDANKSAGVKWTADVLDQYLLAPGDIVPGTTMTYPGLPNDTQRADLIAYLQTLP